MNTNKDIKDITLDTKLVGEIKGEFFVPSYQRGYRWGEFEVECLLNDVYQNGEKNYCLQPVVVRKNDEYYELVDGQQRLTTLYLIYQYMKNVDPSYAPSFSLEYETRKDSANFLKKIDLSQKDKNIDFWFIGNAYDTIQKWFEQDDKRIKDIFNYFEKNVKIIWYEVGKNEEAISLFTRLNIGKIPLTSAELVKAMFLSRNNSESDRKKQEEISLQWDNIEKELHNDSLWYFLTNDIKSKYQTRIDLVLDLISDKPDNIREKYFTFFRFDNMHKEEKKPLDEIWRKIQHTFLVLKDWFENHEWYHKIGYLIASNTCPLRDIFALSKNKTKDEFNEALDEEIKKSISLRNSRTYSELSYENSSDYELISKLLLLFNVESVRQIDGGTQRFPFDKFKSSKESKGSWSLEHIHAQQSEGMKTREAWKEWLEQHIKYVKAVGNKEELINEMEKAANNPKLNGDEFKAIHEKVIDISSSSNFTKVKDLHKIANLALLNTADNAALNNSTFDVKRNLIIGRDKAGQYIPFCTKMVFLKYYTSSENNQLHFWGPDDRNAYINAINDKLENYLEAKIVLEESIEKEGA